MSIALLCGGWPAGAVAADTHAFDPVLSLTGDCSSSPLTPLDERPDPGLCPGTAGVDHPKAAFSSPAAVATDFYGDIYVASPGPESNLGKGGRIDVFDAKGNFITEVADDNGPGSLAIDSEGNLYVGNRFNGREVVLYEPTAYEPEAGNIKYEKAPVSVVEETEVGFVAGLDIGRSSDPQVADHLFVSLGNFLEEYESVAEGNDFVEKFSNSPGGGSTGMAVDAARGRIYASGSTAEGIEVRAYKLAPPQEILFTIKGTSVPNGKFVSSLLSLAADEGSGHFFVYDGEAIPPRVYEFDQSGTFIKSIEHGFQQVFGTEIGVDNGKFSPNGALNPTERYLYVPSHPGGTGHSFAFGPPSIGLPIIESTSVANVGEEEAELQASIEPFGLETHYTFQYLTQQKFEENGHSFNGIPVASEGDIPAGNSPIDVAAAVEGLEPETRYRFRVFAENTEGSDERDAEFATFPPAEPFEPCPNDTLRAGFSALLPDCRAYELVTPPDTNARSPRGVSHLGTNYFATREASPGGGAVSFQIEGGIIPGSEGTGSLGGDPYLSTRGATGWGTAIAGPNGFEVAGVVPGSTSPDQGYSLWNTGANGSAVIGGEQTYYVRYPDGHSALVGRGSLADDPRAHGRLISESGSHIIFVSGNHGPAIQLEPNAPPSGTVTVYDRTADEVTHVVSLLPGDETPVAGQNATYEGASLDGKGVAFEIGNTLYLRFDNEETYELGEGVTFAGIAEGGAKAFYLQGGKLWRFDATSEEATEFSSTPVTPVNVAAGGNVAYFVSQAVLTGEPNPLGAVAQGGQENLYRSEEGAISFVATVTERDVEGESNGNEVVGGLGLWTEKVGPGRLGADPSRTTPDGDALLFESRADLTGYDPEGNAEVYRYDFTAEELDCLSCNPTLAPASGDASLQSISPGLGDPEPFSSFGYVANLKADGNRAFFQSTEALVPGDVDGLQDVYEWEAQGTGSCGREGGCIYLISSGHSLRTDYLYAASDSGDDVFFRTSDILLPRDAEETPSVYDARVEGGFAEEPKEPCSQVAECPPPIVSPPNLSSPRTPVLGPPDNYREAPCPKGKHKVKRHGKTVCVKKKKHKKHHKKHHHKQAGKSGRAGR